MKNDMEEKKLSACESLIMKVIWDAEEDISIPELTEQLRVRFDKDYKRTTVVTFLLRLSDKGYAKTYRKGKLSYAHAVRTEEEFKQKLATEETDFWFRGRAAGFLSALAANHKLTKKDAEEIRAILDDLDD
jgi:predicted transcriptional regulator